jgi:hypothetical protein
MYIICLFIIYCVHASTKIPIDDTYESHFSDDGDNIVFKSQNNISFSLTIYTKVGKSLKFKGTEFKIPNDITYFEIQNLGTEQNVIKIKMLYNELSYWKLILSIIPVISIFVVIFNERKTKIAQVCLSLLVIIEIYKATDYTMVASRIIRKILF